MHVFEVNGISRVSGEPMTLRVHASDGGEAREVASRNGVTPLTVAKRRGGAPERERGPRAGPRRSGRPRRR